MFRIQPKPRRIDFIYYETNFLTSYEITKLETQLDSISYQKGIAGDPNDIYGKLARSSKVKWLPQSSEWKWLYDKIIIKMLKTNEDYWGFNLNDMHDAIQYSTYFASEKGKYDWHLDVGPGVTSYRKLSAVIPLTPSTLYKGGKLEFFSNQKLEENDLKLINEVGTITMFPSYILHRITPVTEGSRNSLVIWMGGVPFR
jgi:PKHD-type hydroxylase